MRRCVGGPVLRGVRTLGQNAFSPSLRPSHLSRGGRRRWAPSSSRRRRPSEPLRQRRLLPRHGDHGRPGRGMRGRRHWCAAHQRNGHGRSALRTFVPLGFSRCQLLGWCRAHFGGGLLRAGGSRSSPLRGGRSRPGLGPREHRQRSWRRGHGRLVPRWPPHSQERACHCGDDLAVGSLPRRQADPISHVDHERTPFYER